MLIRSQNKKELHNLNNISMIEVTPVYGEDEDGFLVWINHQKTIGVYSTQEKAIKVLDMIQNEYGTHYYGNGGPMATANFYIPPFGYIPPKVFQMPQDSEV